MGDRDRKTWEITWPNVAWETKLVYYLTLYRWSLLTLVFVLGMIILYFCICLFSCMYVYLSVFVYTNVLVLEIGLSFFFRSLSSVWVMEGYGSLCNFYWEKMNKFLLSWEPWQTKVHKVQLDKSLNLLELLLGAWITQKPFPAWVIAQKSCIPEAPCMIYRQLDKSENLLFPTVVIACIGRALAISKFQELPDTFELFTSWVLRSLTPLFPPTLTFLLPPLQ